jgi:hypothetical protein
VSIARSGHRWTTHDGRTWPSHNSTVNRPAETVGEAATVLMQHEIEAEAERKGARHRSTLDEMFTGVTEYHPIRDDEAVVGGDVQVKLRGQVLRLNPRRRIATVALPSVGPGSVVSCRLRDAGEALASAVESATACPVGAASARWSR